MKQQPSFWGAVCACAFVVFGAGGSSASEYVELDFVEATGAQWVDTGVLGRRGTKAEVKVEWLDVAADTTILASRGGGDTRINFFNTSQGKIGYGYGTFSSISIVTGINCMWEKHRVYTATTDFASSADGALVNVVVDGLYIVSNKTSVLQIDSGCNLVVFGNNVAGTVTGCARARCYGLKIWQDDLLVRDFVPVSVDGRAGFRDKLSGDFFYSATGTDLVAGPTVDDPDEFVDYVESPGNAYVDLEVVGKSGVKMESRMMWVEIPDDGSYVAARKGANIRFYLLHHYFSHTIGYGDYFRTGYSATAGEVYDVFTELKAGTQVCTVNGTTIHAASSSSSFDTGLNLFLFACNKDGVRQYPSKARCYSLKLWDGDVLVRNFRPCIKRGEACLYDEVSGRIFRAKEGTLKFGKLPTPGKPDYFVSYIESKGNNYLDTGIRARNDTRAECDFEYTQARNSGLEISGYLEAPVNRQERTLVGACNGNGGSRFYLCHGASGQLWVGYGNLREYPTNLVTGSRVTFSTNRHQFDVSFASGSQQVVFDGNTLDIGPSADYAVDAGYNIYLFACDYGGSPRYHSCARCYSLKIWQDGSPVRDLRPCVKDGKAGFYDSVNDEIIYTAFQVDPSCIGEIDLTDAKPVKQLEYVETDGTQWYDTGVTGRVGTVARMRMMWLPGGNDVCFLGCRKNNSGTRFYMWHFANASMACGMERFWYFNGTDYASPWSRDLPELSGFQYRPMDTNRVYDVIASFGPSKQTVFVDGAPAFERNAPSDLDTGLPMYLFSFNDCGTVSSGSRANARLYELKIEQNGEKVRHFVPVLVDVSPDVSHYVTNVLYDKVEHKIYRPLGAPITKWGPEIGKYVEMRGVTIIVR